MPKRTEFKTLEFGLVILRNPFKKSNDYGKYCAVNETRNRGWWIPGGAVDYGESFEQAAIRECKEEAGIDIKLKGILKIDHSVYGDECRMRVIFYAEPLNLEQSKKLKKVPDSESVEARWVSPAELLLLAQNEKIRGDELFQWSEYLEKGGQIWPLEMFSKEGKVLNPKSSAFQIARK